VKTVEGECGKDTNGVIQTCASTRYLPLSDDHDLFPSKYLVLVTDKAISYYLQYKKMILTTTVKFYFI